MTSLEPSNPLSGAGLLAGFVFAQGVETGPTPPALQEALAALVLARAKEEFPPPELKEAVRALLRTGGFKPSGRSKPASEYLASAAREARFPTINNLVDVINYVSLETGLPASLLDADALGPRLSLRYGKPGESYVFNATGQTIDLAGLICLCGGDGEGTPFGNPVKDAMAGKLTDATRNVVGIVYAPAAAIPRARLEETLGLFARFLKDFGGATATATSIR